MPSLRLEEKVAQLFLVGSDSISLEEELEPFYYHGLGGLILFRHHLQPIETAVDLRRFLQDQARRFQGAGLTFVGVDQEGGQVERLPHWLCPTGILPVAYGLKGDVAFCETVNREVARRLRWLGFNLNFTPTVDLNRERLNPIIGVRAYGDQAEQVIPFAQAVINAHRDAGVLPVAKHFPGHGSGTVDSHLALPLFEAWAEDELRPYEALIRDQLPAVLVAHGLYPLLAKRFGTDPTVPASLSEPMVMQLLRNQLGFRGLVFTDDLMMNAVWENADPVEVALKALTAGADILVYRRAQPEALSAFETIVSRIQRGKLSEAWLDDKVQRILATKARLDTIPIPTYLEAETSPDACHAQSLHWAQHGLIELHHHFVSPLPFSQHTRWGLIAPDRAFMRHYEPDATRGHDLEGWCRHYSMEPQTVQRYPYAAESLALDDTWPDTSLQVLVFVAFNSHLYSGQQALYEALKARYPQAKMILASAGMPTDREMLSQPWIHVQLPSFRPAAMQALAQWLITPPRGSGLS